MDRGPGEQVLLDGTLPPETSRTSTTTRLIRTEYVTRARFRAFLPQPPPETIASVPVETGVHAAGVGAVAVVVRPASQDGVDLLKLLAKTDLGSVTSCQLLDPSTQIAGLRFGDFDARAVAVAFIPSHCDVESEELAPVGHGRDPGLLRRQLQAGGQAQVFGQGGFLRLSVFLRSRYQHQKSSSGGVRFPSATRRNIYVRSQRAGERVMASVSRFLTTKLRLKVNEAKSAVARPEDRKFLGFSISNDGSERRIAPKALDRFRERIREQTGRTRGLSLPQIIEELAPYLIGWRGYFGFCQTPRVLAILEAWIRRRLRSYLWRQWGNGKNR